jgi:PKHD-type hydroxylase
MEYILTPNTPYVWWDDAFNEREIAQLQKIALNSSNNAGIGGPNGYDASIRRSQVQFLPNSPEYRWVYERLGEVVSRVNANYYRFDLTGFGEQLQMTNYNSEEQGTYGWHMDMGVQGVSRKLSLVLQLTDPSQYEGGNLEILAGSNASIVEKKKGRIVLFPSWMLHRVTPVTKGQRQSLVVWVSGPYFI